MEKQDSRIGIVNSSGSWPVKEPAIANMIRFVMNDLRINGEIDLFLTNNAAIRMYNKKYRSIDEPTDVLSFSMTEGEPVPLSAKSFGNIIISWDEMIKDAEEISISLDGMMVRLIVHSILHLSGYDHIKENDKIKMQKKEKRLIELFQNQNRDS